eukprot:2097862-Pyramimonas_sp.AAC.1
MEGQPLAGRAPRLDSSRAPHRPRRPLRRRLRWSGTIVLSVMLAWTRMAWSLRSTAFSVSPRRSCGVFSRRFAPWKAPG